MLSIFVVFYLYINLHIHIHRGTLVPFCRLIFFCNLFMGSGSPTACLGEKIKSKFRDLSRLNDEPFCLFSFTV